LNESEENPGSNYPGFYNISGRHLYFIGEESGGSYITANNKFQTRYSLNHTQLYTVKITTSVETAVSGLTRGRGVLPDYEVNPTIEDYLHDRDVEREYALGLIKKTHLGKW